MGLFITIFHHFARIFDHLSPLCTIVLKNFVRIVLELRLYHFSIFVKTWNVIGEIIEFDELMTCHIANNIRRRKLQIIVSLRIFTDYFLEDLFLDIIELD